MCKNNFKKQLQKRCKHEHTMNTVPEPLDIK